MVSSASGARVRLCPAALDGESTTWVLLRRLCLASATPCCFRVRCRWSRWGAPNARAGRFVACPLVVPSFEFCRPGALCWAPVRSTLRHLKTSRSSSDLSRLLMGFSSSHCWSFLHWRHRSVVRSASAGDRYLSFLQPGDCGLPLRRRVHSRIWLVACLPLLREWRTATSQYP